MKNRSIAKSVFCFWFRFLNALLHFGALCFIVAPLIIEYTSGETTLKEVWTMIDKEATGAYFLDYVYFLLRKIWIEIGEIPSRGIWIQKGIILAVSLETIGYFLGTFRRAIQWVSNEMSSTTRKLKGAKMSKGYDERFDDPDAEGYKPFKSTG